MATQIELTESYCAGSPETELKLDTIGDRLRSVAATRGDALALVEILADGARGREWTWPQLMADAEKLAGVLAARHEKGARVAVWSPNLPEWVLLELACGFAGVVMVTVNPAYQPKELDYVLRQSEAEALYYVDSFRGNPMGDIARQVCAEIPEITLMVDLNDWDALFAGTPAPLPEVRHRDPVQIQYTSGTTGFPKGALLHHGGLVQCGTDFAWVSQIGPGSPVLSIMPLFHTAGCVLMVLGPLCAGATMFLPPMFDPALVVDVLEREKIEMFFGVPTMLHAGLEALGEGQRTLHLKAIGTGGAPSSPELVRRVEKGFGAPLLNCYGQTETSPGITFMRVDDDFEDRTTTIGSPLPHVEVKMIDPASGALQPVGVQGEICARGYNIMLGYYNNPEATANTIDEESWLHTGDLGTMDPRGYVRITGRLKEMIIRGGENLFPVEIENAILEHPAVGEAAVVGIPDEKWGEQVACFMKPSGVEKPDAATMKQFIRTQLSPQKTPYYWVWVDDWPLTGSGKIQKFKLAEQFADGQFQPETA